MGKIKNLGLADQLLSHLSDWDEWNYVYEQPTENDCIIVIYNGQKYKVCLEEIDG